MNIRRFLQKTVMTMIAAGVLTGFAAAQHTGAQGFTNGSFEQDMTGWKTGTFGTYSIPVISIEKGSAPEGAHVLKLSALDDNTRGWAEQRFTVRPNTVYIIEGTIKTFNVTHNRMGIQLIEYPSGSDTARTLDIQQTLAIRIGKNTQDWTTYQTAIKTSPETATLTVRIYLGTHGPVQKGAVVWADGLRVTEQAAGFAVNRLPNAGFEQKTASSDPLWEGGFEPAHWMLWTAKNSKKVRAALDSDEKQSGMCSARFTLPPKSRIALHTAVPVDSAKTYTFSAALKTEIIEGSVYARIIYFDAENKQIAGKLPTTHIVRGTTPWTDYTLKLAPPAGAIKVKIECFTDDASGTVWFDSCSLTED